MVGNIKRTTVRDGLDAIMKHANDEDFRMEQLSALADGELGSEQAAALVHASRQDASMLQTWGSYHAIGDALRAHVRDAQASSSRPLAAQLPRLAEQPVVPLPSRPAAANDSLFRWKLVAGVAALAAVGSVVWALVGAQGGPVGAQLAQRSAPAPTAVATASADAAPASAATTNAAESAPVMIRDARLDELLAAHKQFGGASALQQPAGFLRNATFQQAGR
jgi:sigma-E factor negative regulatory protein RseA